jgi:hypothetical protein
MSGISPRPPLAGVIAAGPASGTGMSHEPEDMSEASRVAARPGIAMGCEPVRVSG